MARHGAEGLVVRGRRKIPVDERTANSSAQISITRFQSFPIGQPRSTKRLENSEDSNGHGNQGAHGARVRGQQGLGAVVPRRWRPRASICDPRARQDARKPRPRFASFGVCEAVACDITPAKVTRRGAGRVSAPDILVNNAGGRRRGAGSSRARLTARSNMLTPIELIRAPGRHDRAWLWTYREYASSSVKAPIDVLGLSNGARSGLTGLSRVCRSRSRPGVPSATCWALSIPIARHHVRGGREATHLGGRSARMRGCRRAARNARGSRACAFCAASMPPHYGQTC